MTGLRSIGRSTDMHKAWLVNRPVHRCCTRKITQLGRSTGDRSTFSVSRAMTEGIERSTGQSTAHLGQSTGEFWTRPGIVLDFSSPPYK